MEQHDIYDLGLTADVSMLMRSAVDRRRVLKLGAIGLTALLTGCQPPAGPGGGPQARQWQLLSLAARPTFPAKQPVPIRQMVRTLRVNHSTPSTSLASCARTFAPASAREMLPKAFQ